MNDQRIWNIWSRAQIFLWRGERCRQRELAADSGPRERFIGQPLRERSPRGWSLPGGRDIAHSMAILSQASGRWSPCFRHFRYVFVSIALPLPPLNTVSWLFRRCFRCTFLLFFFFLPLFLQYKKLGNVKCRYCALRYQAARNKTIIRLKTLLKI